MKKQATIADILKVQQDFFYSNPDNVVTVLLGADKRTANRILRECGLRGLNLESAFDRALRRHNAIFGKNRISLRSRKFLIPIHFSRHIAAP